jgi:hypothetical protein
MKTKKFQNEENQARSEREQRKKQKRSLRQGGEEDDASGFIGAHDVHSVEGGQSEQEGFASDQTRQHHCVEIRRRTGGGSGRRRRRVRVRFRVFVRLQDPGADDQSREEEQQERNSQISERMKDEVLSRSQEFFGALGQNGEREREEDVESEVNRLRNAGILQCEKKKGTKSE